jgi:WhiB family redox-sensing transcriptional regulator
MTLATLLAVGWQDRDWTASALCAQTDPEIFFPNQGESPSAAKAVCARCPVRSPCLEEALATARAWGVWGGMTPSERRAEAARRKAERLNTTADEAAGEPDAAA